MNHERVRGDGAVRERVLGWIAKIEAAWPQFLIHGDDGSPYLKRYYLTPDRSWWRRRLPGLFLHRFYRGDHDRELHNHPWSWSAALVVWGGYREIRQDGTWGPRYEMEHRPGSVNVIWDETFHRVELIDPRGSWSLFLVGPSKSRTFAGKQYSDWGFLLEDTRKVLHWQVRDVLRHLAREPGMADWVTERARDLGHDRLAELILLTKQDELPAEAP